MQEEHVSDRMMFEAAKWETVDVTIRRACWKRLGHVARMHVSALRKLALWGWALSITVGSSKRLQGSWRWTMASCRLSFFPRMRASEDQALRLRTWKRGSALPMPLPKRVRRYDAVPSNPSSPSVCPVCHEDLGSVMA